MKPDATQTTWTTTRRALGKTVARVERILFADEEAVDLEGPIQFTFTDGSVLHFKGLGDGSLVAVRGRFSSPYVDKRESKNDSTGADGLTCINFSSREPYRRLIGQTVYAVSPVEDEDGTLAGVKFLIGTMPLIIYVGADDCSIACEHPEEELRACDLAVNNSKKDVWEG